MDIEKIEINEMPKDGVIRILTARGLDEKPEAEKMSLVGTIKTPFEIITKRLTTIDILNSHIAFSYENSFIQLFIGEDDHNKKVVQGKMIKTSILGELNVNNGNRWSCFDLADLFRLNRALFLDKGQAMKIVAQLNNFKAKVEKELEQQKDNRANYNFQKRQVVESNLPESFTLALRIFKGMPKQNIIVEIDIDPNSLECILISPELAEIVENASRFHIDEQLELIAELCPELPIIEA